MLNSRQTLYISSSSLFCIILFQVTFLYGLAFSANHEASTLFSWLHTPSTSPPPPFFSNWNILDPNPCNWTSITCSSVNFVTEINIQSIPLLLPIPSNLSSFHSLQKLVISDAILTGTIPSEIGDCSSLIVIDLSSNNLVGYVPSSFGKLQNLQNLSLNSNQITGKIPVELSNCIALKNLLLFDNQIGGTIQLEFGKLSQLESLRVGGNKDIVGKIPAMREQTTYPENERINRNGQSKGSTTNRQP